MSIYHYSVNLGNRDPMYGNTKVLKECGENKDEALKWADENGRHLGESSDLVYVEEAEYVSEDNLKKGISLYCRPIWSAAFHGYSEKRSFDLKGENGHMYEKLEQLARLNEEMNVVIAEVKKCNKELAAEYKERENETLKHLMSEVHKIAEFGKQIVRPYNAGYGTDFDTGIDMNWYKGSYGKGTDLSFSIDSDGSFEFTTYPSGYSGRQTIYSSKDDKWKWYEDECKKFIATHANEILFAVQNLVEKNFEATMVKRVEQVQAEQCELLMDIGKVSNDKDTNLDAKLKDAIERAGLKQDDKSKSVHKEAVIE